MMRYLARLIHSRQGDEFIEAALVLPTLILTVLSMILLIMHFYLCLDTQIQVHGNLMKEVSESKALFRICTESDSVSSKMAGMTDMILSKNITGRMYVLDYAEIVRAGEMVEFD